jgi:hypothetical protein
MPMTISGSSGLTFPDTSTQTTGKQVCKAWVNFNGQSGASPVIRGSFNVSSVTRSGTGSYVVNFTTAMPDANYSWTANTWGYSISPADSGTPITASSLSLSSYYVSGTSGQRAAWDTTFAAIAIFSA